MGCHTWCYKKSEIQYPYEEVRLGAEKMLLENIEFCENLLGENLDDIDFYTPEGIESSLLFYRRLLRLVQADRLPNGIYPLFCQYTDLDLKYIKGKGFYIGLEDWHDIFRIGNYPEDVLSSREECTDFLERHKDEVHSLHQEHLDEFWDTYPDGMLRFG